MEQAVFWFFAALSVLTALVVVTARNPLHGALALIGSFFGISGIYALLRAHLLAALQVLVYAGAVMVLFVFVIMLLNLKDEELGAPRITLMKLLGGGGLVLAGAGLVSKVLWNLQPGGAAGTIAPLKDFASEPGFGTVAGVGRLVYTQYTLPFEVTSVLLLVAIVGAVVIARSRI